MRPNLEVIFLHTAVRRLADKRLCYPLPRLLLLCAYISHLMSSSPQTFDHNMNFTNIYADDDLISPAPTTAQAEADPSVHCFESVRTTQEVLGVEISHIQHHHLQQADNAETQGQEKENSSKYFVKRLCDVGREEIVVKDSAEARKIPGDE
jgi:hypothetical protein